MAYASPPPPVHTVITSESFHLPPVQPVLLVHTTTLHESMPPPPKDHKTTPYFSHIEKGKKPIISTCMTKSSSATHSKI
jgi:hypothetical protein